MLKRTENLKYKDSSLDRDIISAARRFGTPAYVYSGERIVKSYRKLKKAIGEKVDIFYSIKANPNISICGLLKSIGSSVEVCSSFELDIALKAKFKPNKILFLGPFKKDEDIKKCIKKKVLAIVCESFEEIETLEKIASELKQKCRVMVRVNPEFSAKNALLKMGGKPSQFGIDEVDARSAIKKISESIHLEFMGLHIYNGTRILDAETIVDNTKNVLKLAEKYQEEIGCIFKIVDFGGGAGVPYFEGEQEIDLEVFEEKIKPVIDQYVEKYPNTQLIMESGRFLVGSSGTLVVGVHSIKQSKGEKFIVTDGGTNLHMAAVGIGSVVKNNFPISVLGKDNQECQDIYNITGPLCTPNDLIGKKVPLPEVRAGDMIAIHQSGAYGLTASPVYFLSHGLSNEILMYKRYAYLIRKADKFKDLIRNQVFIHNIIGDKK